MSLQRIQIAALAVAAACGSEKQPTAGPPLASSPAPGVVTASPDTPSRLLLAAGDSAIDLASSPFGPEAAILVRAANGATRIVRWTAGASTSSPMVDLPAGFVARGIAAHPTKSTYFVSGTAAGKSQILSIDSAKTTVVFETPREIGRLIVGPRPFQGDSGTLHRLFFTAKLANGGSSLRSVTERGTIEYQVVGPAAEAIALREDLEPGGLKAPFGSVMSFHPRGEPLLWQDERGCAHTFSYDSGWKTDKPVKEIPCDGSTIIAPNGTTYLHWRSGQAGVVVIGIGVATPAQATDYTFSAAPVAVPDGRGVLGLATTAGQRAVVYAPVDIPLGSVANAWQFPADRCELDLLAREGGSFRDFRGAQLFSVYDAYNYDRGPRAPFLVTTDLLWENFGAAFNGVFILSEKQRAMAAFWSFVDSANTAFARIAPGSKWSRGFAAIADSRKPNATGEAGLIARDSTMKPSTVVDSVFNFAELKPRGHYTTTPAMKQYFRGVHYLTEISKGLRGTDSAALAGLPAGVHEAARRWIDVYRPFISPPRGALVWSGGAVLPVAPYAKHPGNGVGVFPLSWGLDNEVLESTVWHRTWPLPEQIVDRFHPSGLDVASVYGNAFARALLGPDFKRFPRLEPVMSGIMSRRPRVSESSTVYERWLDALGAEWADSIRLPGAPASSKLWDAKRLQTGLASWATLREATILVNERASAAEAGEGGFEDLILETPRGYVEPAPRTFEAIASLYESLSRTVKATNEWEPSLRAGIVVRLDSSAAEARRFGAMAERERRGQPLTDADYEKIRTVGGSAEHSFLIYKGLATTGEGLQKPDPMPKIADVAGDLELGVLEAAVGDPIVWRQIVPHFGRRQIVVGGIYSYHEFVSKELYDNERWRKEVSTHPHPAWVQPLMVKSSSACSDTAR